MKHMHSASQSAHQSLKEVRTKELTSMVRWVTTAAAAGAFVAWANARAARQAEQAHPPVGRRIEAKGASLNIVESGAGDPVLFLHGNGAMIQETTATGLPELLAHSHRVIIPDRPGFGHSSRPSGTAWTPERQAELMAEMLHQLSATPALVVAHSWGTLVAVALAIHFPEAIRGLVLVSGYYYPVPRADQVLSLLGTPVIGHALRYTTAPLTGRLMAKPVIDRFFEPNTPTQRFNEHYPISLAVRPSQLRAFGEEVGMMLPAAERLSKRYGDITCPTAILAGHDDRVIDTQKQSVRLAGEIKGSHLQVLDGTGHMLPHVAPDVVMGAIAEIEGMTNTGGHKF